MHRIGEPTQASCNLRPWLVGFGFFLGYGSLLAKNFRIMLIFGGAKKLKKKSFTDKQLMYYLTITTAPGLISFT